MGSRPPAEQGLRTIPLSAGFEDRPAEAGLEEHPAFSGLRGKEQNLALSPEGTLLKRSGPQVTPQAERSLSHAVGVTVAYYLEDWDLNGKKTMHGPVTPVRSDKPLLKYGNATLLSNLGKRQNQKYDEFWRIQETSGKADPGSPRRAGLEDQPAFSGP